MKENEADREKIRRELTEGIRRLELCEERLNKEDGSASTELSERIVRLKECVDSFLSSSTLLISFTEANCRIISARSKKRCKKVSGQSWWKEM